MKEKEILKKLSALKTHIAYTDRTSTNVTVEDYEKYITSFENYWKELITINKELYEDFKPISFLPYSSDAKTVPVHFLRLIVNNIQYLINIGPDDSTIVPTDFKITNEGIFFSGQYYDAFIKVSEILKSAQSEIVLIDGYISDNFLDIFTTINSGVKVKILTKSKSNNAMLKLKVTSFNKQFNSKGITLEVQTNEDFHDRFLIIDQKEFYHFGASLKDVGNKGFMFSKMEEPIIQKSLLAEFNAKWT